jgi:SAM-dependent methyltransferase
MTALNSPAAERNKQPIADALLRLLPATGAALEIASGSGQHVAHFAALMPGWSWLASDPSEQALASIRAWWPAGPDPLQLDVHAWPWPLPSSHRRLDLVFSANMLHISPWSSCAALLRGAAQHLREDGRLIVYGPFIVPGEPTAPSNSAFDADLRRRDPAWGLRSLDAVELEARAAGLRLRERIAMPANNLLLIFQPQDSKR